ncbi:MAG: F0F1 ATP synthase subunit delta [Patescibacteria group bacterium]
MQPLSKDARGFVDGIVGYLQREDKDSPVVGRVRTLLHRVTVTAKQEKLATIESSVGLTVHEKGQISHVLARILGHSVALSVRVKPEVLAGLRIQVGDWVVDTSLAHQVDVLAQSLLE